MKIKKLEITNFRGIGKAEIDLLKGVNVFVGINGSGKSSMLDAIAILLSWLVNRIQRPNASGRPIPEASIKNDTPFAELKLTVSDKGLDYIWSLNKGSKGNSIATKSYFTEVSDLASTFQSFLPEIVSLPVIAYYPINRAVERISPESSVKDDLSILDVYENSLGGKTNYQSFFEWFRLQDDITNEKAQFRSSWMRQNKKWLKNRIERIIGILKELNQNDQIENEWFTRLVNRFGKDDFIFEEPRFLIRLLLELFDAIDFRQKTNLKYTKIMHDIEYMMHQMMSLSEYKMDNLIDSNILSETGLKEIIQQFYILVNEQEFDLNNTMIAFLWDVLLFTSQLSLWWFSDKSKKELDRLFLNSDPTKQKTTKRDPSLVAMEFRGKLGSLINNESNRVEKATKSGGRESKWVTEAIENFVPGYKNLRVTRIPRSHLLIDKEGITISLDQLSDGEKNLLVLVGDIARRLSIANPNSNKPLEAEGIILIDEIDLHLHPSWQRLMIPQLTKIFPNCQFIITTHSPQILSHTKPEHIFILKNEKDVFSYSKPIESYGQTTDRILEDLLSVSSRPKEEKEMIHKLFVMIQDGELDKAMALSSKLSQLIGDDPELSKANILIKRKAFIGK